MSDAKSCVTSTSTVKLSPFKIRSDRQIILSIEGNIGVGKTTFLKLLKNKLSIDFHLINEPVD